MIDDRRQFLRAATMSVIGARLGVSGKLMARTALQLSIEGELPSFAGASGWLNSAPLTPTGLRGKVVLVDFWTYTCVNWLRTLPYVRAWSEKYRNIGLVVIGVHTPEFPFEKNVDNVRRATKAMRIDYPIAMDSDYAVWRAFNNEYWRRSISSMPRDAFDITNSGRADTTSPR
jgi:thiol-disulfide isomerase/thioredoxin